MTKPTASDKLLASHVVQRLIENYLEEYGNVEADGVIAELNRIHGKLVKADERLLQPKPKQPRKPQASVQVAVETDWIGAAPQAVKATFEPTEYENRMPKTGRQKS